MRKACTKIGYWIAALIFVGVLFAPVGQRVFSVFPETELKGVLNLTDRPVFTKGTWLDGSFQRDFTNWFEERLGFKPALVKTDNQMNFVVFKEISASTKAKIVLGHDNFLYEKGYIDAWNGKDAVGEDILRPQLEDLDALNAKLSERGIELVFVITPVKPALYPENVPRSYISPNKKPTSYENIVPLLEEFDVTVVDSHAILAAHKASSTHPVFSHGGTHWNYYGACIVVSKLADALESQIDCGEPVVDNKPYGTDRDLAELINLWDDHVTDGPTPHPLFTDALPREPIPKVLFVGDSFVWTITTLLDARTVYDERSVYYYNSTRYADDGAQTPVDAGSDEWLEDILSHDVIVIEATHTALNDIGFGFVQELLKVLE